MAASAGQPNVIGSIALPANSQRDTPTPTARVALVLYAVHDFGYVEIAAATDVGIGTAKSRIHRDRLALRDLLFEHRDLFADLS